MTGQAFHIKGAPIPQPRPRFKVVPLAFAELKRACVDFLAGRKVKRWWHSVSTYTPAKHPVTEWRRTVRAELLGAKKLEGAIDVSLIFHLQRPKSHYRTGRNAHLVRDGAPQYPTSKKAGDVDNLAKPILDEMNEVVLTDDSHVLALHILKLYAPQGAAGCYIQIRESPHAREHQAQDGPAHR